MKNTLIMKNLTDIRKTVETGVDPRWLSDLIPVIYPALCANQVDLLLTRNKVITLDIGQTLTVRQYEY